MNKYCKDITKYTFSPEIKDICKPLQFIGVSGFFYIRRFPNGDFINLSTNPDINVIFFEKFYNLKYKPQDIANHILTTEKTVFSEFSMDSEIWLEAKHFFKLGSAILISKTLEGYCETFCFCLSPNSPHSGEFLQSHRYLLEQFMRYFHVKAKSIIEQAEKDKFYIPEFYLNEQCELTSDHEVDIDKFITFVCAEGFYLGESYANAKITPKEAACLYWIYKGKSIDEISILLKNSPRTIESHVTKIKEKFQCHKTTNLSEKVSKMHLDQLLHNWIEQYES